MKFSQIPLAWRLALKAQKRRLRLERSAKRRSVALSAIG